MASPTKTKNGDAGDAEADLDQFKAMIRNSNSELQDSSLHRSQEFVGGAGADSSFSPRSGGGRSSRPKVVKAGVLHSPDRPDDWIGSPGSATKRKSYKVKNHVPNVMPPPPPPPPISDGEMSGPSSPSAQRSPGKATATAAASAKPPPPPAGVTRHTLGASSSHHDSTWPLDSTSKGSSSHHTAGDVSSSASSGPDPEKFKAMMRESMMQQQDDLMNRSQEFLGGSDHDIPKSSFHSVGSNDESGSKNVKHKWGAPVSPEQFRPDDWLGSPSSASKRKSYTIKSSSPVVSPIPNLDNSDSDDAKKTTAGVGLLPKSPLLSGVRGSPPSRRPRTLPGKAQSIAIGATAPKYSPKTTTKPSRPVGRPVKSQSLGLGQRSPGFGGAGSPIQTQERVDRNKFVNAFTAFEGHSPGPPSAFLASSPTVTSPKRNFRISQEAKERSASLRLQQQQQNSSSNSNNKPGGGPPQKDWSPINQAIANLRKVAIPTNKKSAPPKDECEQQASEILHIVKYLRHNRVVDDIPGADMFLRVIQNLRRESIIAAHMNTEELNEIHGSIIESMDGIVQQMDYKEPHRLEIEVCARILNQLSASNPRSIGMLEDVIGRLKKIPNNGALKQVTERMEEISWNVGQRETKELAIAIRNSEPADMKKDDESSTTPAAQWDDLTMVLLSLEDLVGDVSQSSAQFLGMEDSSASLSMAEYSPRGRNTIISPQANARRNFKVTDSAKKRSMEVLDLSAHSEKSEPEEELQAVLASLRRVVVTPKDVDKSGQQASELLQMVQHLRKTGGGTGAQKELFDLFEDLNQHGVLSSNLGPNRMEKVRKAITRLNEVGRQTNYDLEAKDELYGTVKYLRKLTPTSAGAVDTLQQAIARLKHVRPNLRDPSGVDDVIDQLQQVALSMREGQEAELAEAIRDLKGDGGSSNDNKDVDELEHVLAGLKAKRSSVKKAEEENAKLLATHAKERLTPEDADYLVYALLKLKKTKMNKKEAAAVAGFIRKLRPVQTPEEEKMSDEALAKLRQQIDTNKKSREILRVLKGLRRLNLNDPERFELAEIVRSLGKGEDKYRDEITDAIAKLRRVRMTGQEAKEVAGIMFNLRKAKKGGFDIDNSREMVNLRKVMDDAKAEVVAETFNELAKVDLSEKEIDEFAGIVAELEVQPLAPTEHQLITIEYIDGQPFMVLNIPYGKDYASKMKNLGIADHIKKKKAYKTREIRFWIELDPEDELSDELMNDDDSDFEKDSDDEKASPSGKKKKLTIKMKTKKSSTASPKPSPKPTTAKKLNHYGAAQETDAKSLVQDEEREKKIRFNTKPQWRYKKHNTTVVNEKRWRFEEGFNADEVIWSPLSRDQYDRRKTVGASILATMDKFAPLDDMLLDEFEKDEEGGKKK